MRTRFASLLGAAAFAAATLGTAQAQNADNYPSRQISFICAFPAGSGADVLVRYFAEKVGRVAGVTTIVDNKPGAAGNIASEFSSKARPDGYTIYVHAGSSVASNMHLYRDPPFHALEDFQVAATINRQAFMVTVAADSPYQTMQELTEAMREKGDRATYGISATSGKVMGALYNDIAGLQAVEVSYRNGNDIIPELMSGVLDYAMNDPVVALSHAREGRLRVLAVASGERLSAAPDIPTMIEGGVAGVDLNGWFAAMVPKATPRPIVDKINGWFEEVLRQDETREFLQANGGDVYINTPDDGQALLEKAYEDWAGYVRTAGIEPQ